MYHTDYTFTVIRLFTMIMFVVFCVCFQLPQRAKYALQTSYIKCVQAASKLLQPKTIIATNITLRCREELSKTNPMCSADCDSTTEGVPLHLDTPKPSDRTITRMGEKGSGLPLLQSHSWRIWVHYFKYLDT